ncbi:SDR family oxidoreductase [Rothia sp. AR01]|uniref:SDR family oxidoreductase n=1 Tax=Rothia santali TaxID=2949643 RepID=A0A9X2KK59_9MICC|nr:SDR family oxidoreductase [Rothia santali]MCP3424691.1 SDR family oxidoreductase [Rothia santali]
MDYDIAGRWAVVCAASRGLGYGCAEALAAQGVNLVINARTPEALETAAEALRRSAPGVEVRTVPGDIGTGEVQGELLEACPQVDILVNNAGGPPAGDFRDWGSEAWSSALRQNMLTPVELIKATVDSMAERGFGRIVNITSSSVKAPIAALGLSNGARSGLTGFVAGIARQPRLASRNVTINNLLPGSFATRRLTDSLEAGSRDSGRDVEELAREARQEIPAGRFGTPEEFGAACAFLCSAQAGYVTGQNLLIDGGAYPGTF